MLCVVSTDRLVAIKFPFTYNVKAKPHMAHLICMFGAIFTCVVCLPMIFIPSLDEQGPCSPREEGWMIVFIVAFTSILCIFFSLYMSLLNVALVVSIRCRRKSKQQPKNLLESRLTELSIAVTAIFISMNCIVVVGSILVPYIDVKELQVDKKTY